MNWKWNGIYQIYNEDKHCSVGILSRQHSHTHIHISRALLSNLQYSRHTHSLFHLLANISLIHTRLYLLIKLLDPLSGEQAASHPVCQSVSQYVRVERKSVRFCFQSSIRLHSTVFKSWRQLAIPLLVNYISV